MKNSLILAPVRLPSPMSAYPAGDNVFFMRDIHGVLPDHHQEYTHAVPDLNIKAPFPSALYPFRDGMIVARQVCTDGNRCLCIHPIRVH